MHTHESGTEAIKRLESDLRTFSPAGIERIAWGWRQHDAEELLLVHIIGRIRYDLERRDDVCDDRIVANCASLRETTGDARPDQRGLDRVSDLMASVEHRVVAPAQ